MQIFIKWTDGTTRTVDDVEPTDLVADAIRKLREKESVGPGVELYLVCQGKELDPGRSFAAQGVDLLKSFQAFLRFSAIDPEVIHELQGDLATIVGSLKEKTFIFVGVGSYDHGHGEASIVRQQCPDRVLLFCEKYSWDLTVVLIDPDFQTPVEEETCPQIYHVDRQQWPKLPSVSLLGGRVRYYRNNTLGGSTGLDRHVVTYGTGIPEYHPIRSLTNQFKIADVPFCRDCLLKIRAQKLESCCVVSGNFFQEPTDKSQYFATGNHKVLELCGITPTL